MKLLKQLTTCCLLLAFPIFEVWGQVAMKANLLRWATTTMNMSIDIHGWAVKDWNISL